MRMGNVRYRTRKPPFAARILARTRSLPLRLGTIVDPEGFRDHSGAEARGGSRDCGRAHLSQFCSATAAMAREVPTDDRSLPMDDRLRQLESATGVEECRGGRWQLNGSGRMVACRALMPSIEISCQGARSQERSERPPYWQFWSDSARARGDLRCRGRYDGGSKRLFRSSASS